MPSTRPPWARRGVPSVARAARAPGLRMVQGRSPNWPPWMLELLPKGLSPACFALTIRSIRAVSRLKHRPAGDEAGNSSVAQEDPAGAEMSATVVDAPSVVPSIAPSANSPGEADADEIENFAARRKRLQARRKQARHSSRWTALILVLFAFNVALVGARGELVRFFPQTASLFAAVGLPVNLRNLKFENMRISKEAQEGLSSLIVEGTIVSVSNRAVEVPRLRFAARDAAGQEVYTWTALPGRSILGPGEKLDFRSRFVSPPDNAVDVMVRFAGAQDAVPGAK